MRLSRSGVVSDRWSFYLLIAGLLDRHPRQQHVPLRHCCNKLTMVPCLNFVSGHPPHNCWQSAPADTTAWHTFISAVPLGNLSSHTLMANVTQWIQHTRVWNTILHFPSITCTTQSSAKWHHLLNKWHLPKFSCKIWVNKIKWLIHPLLAVHTVCHAKDDKNMTALVLLRPRRRRCPVSRSPGSAHAKPLTSHAHGPPNATALGAPVGLQPLRVVQGLVHSYQGLDPVCRGAYSTRVQLPTQSTPKEKLSNPAEV